MKARVIVRPCAAGDLARLEWDGLFTHHREILERTFREHLEGKQVMLVADLDRDPIGQAWIDLRRAADRQTAVFWAIRVHPSRQRYGIGSRLLETAEQIASDRGFAFAELSVDVANSRARAWYERAGFSVRRRVAHSYSYTTPEGHAVTHAQELIEMRKELRR